MKRRDLFPLLGLLSLAPVVKVLPNIKEHKDMLWKQPRNIETGSMMKSSDINQYKDCILELQKEVEKLKKEVSYSLFV